jgi:hypothetical protein
LASVKYVAPVMVNAPPHPVAIVADKVAAFILINENPEPKYWSHTDQTFRIGNALFNVEEVRPDVIYLSMHPDQIPTERELHDILVEKYGILTEFQQECLLVMKQVYYSPWAWNDSVLCQVTDVQVDSFLSTFLGTSLADYNQDVFADFATRYPAKSDNFHLMCVKRTLNYPCIAALMDLFLRNEISPTRVISSTLLSFVIGLGKRVGMGRETFHRHMTCGEAWNLVEEHDLFRFVLIDYNP